jgi:hypothetical protein
MSERNDERLSMRGVFHAIMRTRAFAKLAHTRACVNALRLSYERGHPVNEAFALR